MPTAIKTTTNIPSYCRDICCPILITIRNIFSRLLLVCTIGDDRTHYSSKDSYDYPSLFPSNHQTALNQQAMPLIYTQHHGAGRCAINTQVTVYTNVLDDTMGITADVVLTLFCMVLVGVHSNTLGNVYSNILFIIMLTVSIKSKYLMFM